MFSAPSTGSSASPANTSESHTSTGQTTSSSGMSGHDDSQDDYELQPDSTESHDSPYFIAETPSLSCRRLTVNTLGHHLHGVQPCPFVVGSPDLHFYRTTHQMVIIFEA